LEGGKRKNVGVQKVMQDAFFRVSSKKERNRGGRKINKSLERTTEKRPKHGGRKRPCRQE